MGERKEEPTPDDSVADFFEPALGDMMDDDFEEMLEPRSARHSLAEKRRRAEQRLEQKRLRDELGYYDLEFDDDY